jgi:RHS repeat-associated protein
VGGTTCGSGTAYNYDGDGQRVEKSTGTLYWYGLGGQVLSETALNGNSPVDYIFFNAARLARVSNGPYYYLQDHLQSTRTIVQGNQNSACYEADFEPYGIEHDAITPTCTQNYKFTGKERDSESGLDNFGARYNSSSIGRFMSPDPVFISADKIPDPQTLNLYAYVRNNPLSLTDPTGLDFYLSCEHTKDNEDTCQQIQNGSATIWVQGEMVNGEFQATDVTMNDPNNAGAGYHDQFGNQYTGTFDEQNGVSFTNTATGETSGHSRFIEASDQTDVFGSGIFSGAEGHFFSACGGSCEARGSLIGDLSTAEAALHRQSKFMTAIDLLSGAHKGGVQWKDSNGYVHMLFHPGTNGQQGQFELHFEGHPAGADLTNFVLHMVDTIRDAASGRAAEQRNLPLPRGPAQ